MGTIHLIVEFVYFGATTLLNVTRTNKPIDNQNQPLDNLNVVQVTVTKIGCWLEVGSGYGYDSYWLNLSKAYTDNDTSA